jgi:plastocyanin
MKKLTLIAAAVVALAAAGGAGAYALHTILLKPGHCAKVHGTKVCARKATPRTVIHTVTVAPSPIGQTFTGNGDETLAPLTLTKGDNVHWTASPDSEGDNFFAVSSDPSDTNFVEFDNGDGSTSGTSFIPPGTYTFEVDADGAWSISF